MSSAKMSRPNVYGDDKNRMNITFSHLNTMLTRTHPAKTVSIQHQPDIKEGVCPRHIPMTVSKDEKFFIYFNDATNCTPPSRAEKINSGVGFLPYCMELDGRDMGDCRGIVGASNYGTDVDFEHVVSGYSTSKF